MLLREEIYKFTVQAGSFWKKTLHKLIAEKHS